MFANPCTGLSFTAFPDGVFAMPWTARADEPNDSRLAGKQGCLPLRLVRDVPCASAAPPASGLVLDRQHNHGPLRVHGVCSTAATGMGLIALALASAPPYRLLTPSAARLRIRASLKAAFHHLPHDHGIMPHFVHSASGAVHGLDTRSTIDSSWLVTGALWAAAFLQDSGLEALAARLYERIDWHYWTAPEAPAARG